MHIHDLVFTPVAMGDPPLRNAAGLHAPFALRIIIEVISNEGIYGLGEMPGSADLLADLEAIKPIVIGLDPFQLNTIQRAIQTHFANDAAIRASHKTRRSARAYSPIEVACYDLIGKSIRKPVCDLLGGRVRDAVPFSAYLFFKHIGAGGALGFGFDRSAKGWNAARQQQALSPHEIVAQAESMCKTFGFQSIKLKAGVLDPEIEVASMFALRKAFGESVPLRIDPNAVWGVDTAIKYGKQMESILEYYEDPVRGQANMAQVAQAVGIPLATNMCTTAFEDMPSSIRLDSEDIILSDHHFWGGLRASVALAKMCETFGRGLSMHSNSHLGISLMAMAHLAAATPNLTYACDTHYPWQDDDVVEGGRIPIQNGCVEVTNEPGLGIQLDRVALKRLHQNYLECKLTERNDELEMQKVEPGWKFIAERW